MIVSIPIIFLVTLFILKKFRKIITDDIDKQFLGKLLDKVFGLLYGILFSYILFSAVLHFSNEVEEYFKLKLNINEVLIRNSNILMIIESTNNNITDIIYNSEKI